MTYASYGVGIGLSGPLQALLRLVGLLSLGCIYFCIVPFLVLNFHMVSNTVDQFTLTPNFQIRA